MNVMIDKLYDYGRFVKMRLSSTVVFSAIAGFVLGNNQPELDWIKLCWLVLGGFLVTASSNGFNQISERHLDKIMKRTQNRPLPKGKMGLPEAWIVAVLMGLIGLWILFFKMNFTSGLLGLFALLSYTLAYTPLKQVTSFSVLVGAFPGAIPPLLGWVAAAGHIEIGGIVLFAIQFLWQFPHFWAIAWVLDDDYKSAGFKMLPASGCRDKTSAFQILVYSIGLIPVSLSPVFFNISGYLAGVVIFVAGIWFSVMAVKLYNTCDFADSKRIMLGSFVYLPIIQLALIFDKI